MENVTRETQPIRRLRGWLCVESLTEMTKPDYKPKHGIGIEAERRAAKLSKGGHHRHERSFEAFAQVKVCPSSAWEKGKEKRMCQREDDIDIKIEQNCAGKPKQAWKTVHLASSPAVSTEFPVILFVSWVHSPYQTLY